MSSEFDQSTLPLLPHDKGSIIVLGMRPCHSSFSHFDCYLKNNTHNFQGSLQSRESYVNRQWPVACTAASITALVSPSH